MTRLQRIAYKLLAWLTLFGSVYIFPPTMAIGDPILELLVVSVLFGIIASCLHDAVGHYLVQVLVEIAGWLPLQLVSMYVIIALYTILIGTILWASSTVIIAFLPGLKEVAMGETQSVVPIAVGVTVVAVEAINKAVDD